MLTSEKELPGLGCDSAEPTGPPVITCVPYVYVTSITLHGFSLTLEIDSGASQVLTAFSVTKLYPNPINII